MALTTHSSLLSLPPSPSLPPLFPLRLLSSSNRQVCATPISNTSTYYKRHISEHSHNSSQFLPQIGNLPTIVCTVIPSEKAAVATKSTKPQAPVPPFNVLITGSTKGVGYALAKEFLAAGDRVMICSRSDERVQSSLKELRKEYGEDQVLGKSCDVRDSNSIHELIAFARSTLGYVDIWINNAGSNAYTFKPLVETSDAALSEIVETNMIGVMICCREAIKMMVEQPRGGHIFNMDGAGADGGPTPRFAAYGATKRSLTQFTKTLQAELRMQRVKNVVLHSLSPGMVTTELLMAGSDTEQAKFFINALAEPPEVVAKYLVPRIRSVPGDIKGRSTYIRFLTGFKAYSQIIARILFKARKDRYVKEE